MVLCLANHRWRWPNGRQWCLLHRLQTRLWNPASDWHTIALSETSTPQMQRLRHVSLSVSIHYCDKLYGVYFSFSFSFCMLLRTQVRGSHNGVHGIKSRFRRQLTNRLAASRVQALNEHHHVVRKRYLLAESADIAIDEFVPDLYLGAFDKAVE